MGARTVGLVAMVGLLCLMSPAPAQADPSACSEDLSGLLGQSSTRTLSPGVEMSVWTGLRTADVRPETAVRAAVVKSTGGFAGLRPILGLPRRRDPAALLESAGALAAVNGDLFSAVALDAAVPTGPVVIGRTVLYAPPGRRPVVHWSADRPRVHRSLLRAAITFEMPGGPEPVSITAVNHPSLQSGPVLFRSPWSGRTTRGGATVVLRKGRVADVLRPGRAVTVDRDALVVQVPDGSVLPAALRPGVRAHVTARLGRTAGDTSVIGHGGRLLRDGQVTRECLFPGSLLRPRTALAWNGAGEAWLAVVTNGLDDPPSGMRVGGAAVTAVGRWLASLGATDAVLLDGGGSTIMLRDTLRGPRRVDLPASTYRRPVPVLLGIVG